MIGEKLVSHWLHFIALQLKSWYWFYAFIGDFFVYPKGNALFCRIGCRTIVFLRVVLLICFQYWHTLRLLQESSCWNNRIKSNITLEECSIRFFCPIGCSQFHPTRQTYLLPLLFHGIHHFQIFYILRKPFGKSFVPSICWDLFFFYRRLSACIIIFLGIRLRYLLTIRTCFKSKCFLILV